MAMKWTAPNIFFIVATLAIIYGVLLVGTGQIKLSTTGTPPTNVPSDLPPVGGTQCTTGPQNLSVQSYDVDKPGTALNPAIDVYLSPQNGSLNPGGTLTSTLSSVTVFTTKSNFVSQTQAIPNTGCGGTYPVAMYQKAVDTAVNTQVFNNDGVTINSNAANQSIGLGSAATMKINLGQSASYTHLSGNTNQFAVYVNATNVTDWSPSDMSVGFNGVVCSNLLNTANVQHAYPTSLTGQVIYSAVCTGDFLANDGAYYPLYVKLAAQISVDPAAQNVFVSFAPIQTYKNTVTGVLENGAVKNDGSAIQAFQSAKLWIN